MERKTKKPQIKESIIEAVKPVDIIKPKKFSPTKEDNIALMRENLIESKDGVPMFLNTDKIYDKLCIPDEEAIEFLGGYDPNDYFKNGKIIKPILKVLGKRIEEDTEEYSILEQTLYPYSGFLLFKKDRENLYTILVPKMFSDFAVDYNGEFVEPHIFYDTRVIMFSGVGKVPSSFEAKYFTDKLLQIKAKVKKSLENKGQI